MDLPGSMGQLVCELMDLEQLEDKVSSYSEITRMKTKKGHSESLNQCIQVLDSIRCDVIHKQHRIDILELAIFGTPRRNS